MNLSTELERMPSTLTDTFLKAGIKAKYEGKSFDQAAEEDGERLTAIAKEALGKLTEWDNMILGTAYKLGYETATPAAQ